MSTRSPLICLSGLTFLAMSLTTFRLFEPTSQRSVEHDTSVVLTPMSEVCLAEASLTHWQSQTKRLMHGSENTPELINAVRDMTQSLENWLVKATAEAEEHPTEIDGIEAFLPLLFPETETLMDYLPDDTILVLVEPRWQAREAEQMHEQLQTIYSRRLTEGKLMPAPETLLVPANTLQTELGRYPNVRISLVSDVNNEPVPDNQQPSSVSELYFGMKPLGLGRGNYQMVIDHIKTWTTEAYLIKVYCETPQQAKRVLEMLMGAGPFPGKCFS